MQSLFRFIQRLSGWHLVQTDIPDLPKAVLIFAPHTSNWDFITMLVSKFVWKIQVRFLGKHSLFRWPTGWFFRALGGMPVERSQSHNMVDQVVAMLDASERMFLVLAPEGTRSYTPYWKTGFYHIAHRAGVPIVMFYLDTKTRQIGYSEPMIPTGDIEADFKLFADFYADKVGYKPELTSIVQTKEAYLRQQQQEAD